MWWVNVGDAVHINLETIGGRSAIFISASNQDNTLELQNWDGHESVANDEWRVDRGGVPALARRVGALNEGELSPSEVLQVFEDLGQVAIAANNRLTLLSSRGEQKNKIINPSHRDIRNPGDAAPLVLVERPKTVPARRLQTREIGFMALSSRNPLLEH